MYRAEALEDKWTHLIVHHIIVSMIGGAVCRAIFYLPFGYPRQVAHFQYS